MSAIPHFVDLTDSQMGRTVTFGGFTVLPIWLAASFSGVLDLLKLLQKVYEVVNAERSRLVVL